MRRALVESMSRASRSDRSGAGGPSEETFLTRWARRKRDDADRVPEPEAATPDDAAEVNAPSTPAPKTDADMPPLDSLDETSNYGDFLSPQVSERLRQAALRKLFHLPQFNIRDGLDDYDDDFRVFEPLGDVVTADMRHRMEREAEAARRRLADQPSAAPGPVDGDAQETVVAEGATSVEDDEGTAAEPRAGEGVSAEQGEGAERDRPAADGPDDDSAPA